MAMKTELRGTVSKSLEFHSEEIITRIQNVIDDVKSWVWQEEKLAGIGFGAQEAATKMGSSELIEKVAQDAAEHAKPKIKEAVELIEQVMTEATVEAIRELIVEEIEKKQKGDTNATS